MAHRRVPHQALEGDLERLNDRWFDSLAGRVRTDKVGKAGHTIRRRLRLAHGSWGAPSPRQSTPEQGVERHSPAWTGATGWRRGAPLTTWLKLPAEPICTEMIGVPLGAERAGGGVGKAWPPAGGTGEGAAGVAA